MFKMESMNLQMFTSEQVAKLLHCLPADIEMLSEVGCLNPIRIGNKPKYSYEDIENFQKNYTGFGVSTRAKAREAFYDRYKKEEKT